MKRYKTITTIIFSSLIFAALLGGCGCVNDDDAGDDAGAPDDDSSDDDTGTADDSADDDSTDDDTADDDTGDDDTVFLIDVRAPLSPVDSVLPAGVDSCAVIGDEECVDGTRRACAIYDAVAGSFPDNPPEFAQRAYTQDRYHDLYINSDNSAITWRTLTNMPPGTPEDVWTAPENFEGYDDWGDGAFYMGHYLAAAAHRYAATGTDADYARMVALLNKQLLNWRITGVPGCMSRATFAMLDEGVPVPAGHPEYNLHPFTTRANHVDYVVPEERRGLLPAYYYEGVDIGEAHLNTTPLTEGSPSIDAYSAAFFGQQSAWGLLRPADQALKDEIGRNAACFLKRMKKMRVTHLVGSLFGNVAVQYLTGAGGFHPSPGDIDLTQVDTMIAYVQESIPPGDPGNFNFGCPDVLPVEVDPEYDYDANDPLFIIKLLDLASRMDGDGDRPIDFAYFVSHRGGDVGFLINYALLANLATGEQQYLDFIKNQLVDEVQGLEVLKTSGSFYLPPYCGSWIGGDLIHPILAGTVKMVDDSLLAPEHRTTLKKEFKDKLFVNDNNAFFGVTYASVMSEADDPSVGAYADWAAGELDSYMLKPDFPLDPKRTYGTDYIANPLPGYEPSPPTQEEIDACNTGITLFGIDIVPGPGVDPDFAVISRAPLPVAKRVPHDMIWHFSPFNLRRDYGGREGRDHMVYVDLTVPFWIGRANGLIDSGDGMALAWKDTGEACP